MIGGFRSVLCVSVFQGSFLVIVIMIDGSENAIVKADVCENRSKKKKDERVTLIDYCCCCRPRSPRPQGVSYAFLMSHPPQRELWHLTCPPWADSNQQYRHCFELLDDSIISLFLTRFASISSIPSFYSPLATFTSVKESFTIRSTTQTSRPIRSLLRTTNDNKFLYQ